VVLAVPAEMYRAAAISALDMPRPTSLSTQFARSLIRLGLVDQYRLWVLPAATGQGAALFTELARPLELRLVTSTAFPSGILELVYTPAGCQDPQAGQPVT